MIQAYPDRLSIHRGDTLTVHISAGAPEFKVVIYRQGTTLEWKHDFGWQPTLHPGFETRNVWDQDWNWDAYSFAIPSDWLSGVYIAMLYEKSDGVVTVPDKDVVVSDGLFGKALFVLKSNPPGVDSSILYRVPIATYHAYNMSGTAQGAGYGPLRTSFDRLCLVVRSLTVLS